MTPTTIECIGIIFLTALATAFFIVVFVDLARGHRRANRRRRVERMEEEATAIVAALAAFEKIRELEDKSDGNKKEEDHGKDDEVL